MNMLLGSFISLMGFSLLTFAPVSAVEPAPEATTMTTQNAPETALPESNISEQSATPPTVTSEQTTASPAVETKEFSGKIIKVDDSTLVIDSDQGTKEFKVSSDILIERNTSTVGVDQLKPGDKVTVRAEGDQALSISATAGSTIDKLVKVALIALALLILLLLVKMLLKKRNKGFVTTTPTNVSKGE